MSVNVNIYFSSAVKGYCQTVVLAWKSLGVNMTQAECICNNLRINLGIMLSVWLSHDKAGCKS